MKKSTKKKRPKPSTQTSPAAETELVLRSCKATMVAHSGFVWPRSGPVSAPDWLAQPTCGNGLHGFLHGVGEGTLACWDSDAVWLVVEIAKGSSIDLDGKCKFKKGVVVFAGSLPEAAALVSARHPGLATIGGTATAGDGGTAQAGAGGTAQAGYGGAIAIQWWDTKRGKWRTSVAEVGEAGILPDTPYAVVDGVLMPKVASNP